jgi:hypothetical protein
MPLCRISGVCAEKKMAVPIVTVLPKKGLKTLPRMTHDKPKT